MVSQSQLDEALSRERMAEQDVEQARVARDRARLDLNRAAVRAPFDGIVAERLQQAGEFVASGAPLLRLVNDRELEVVARAPLTTADTVAAGAEASSSTASARRTGKVRAVIPVGDERSRMVELRIALADRAWRVGAPVRVEIAPRSLQSRGHRAARCRDPAPGRELRDARAARQHRRTRGREHRPRPREPRADRRQLARRRSRDHPRGERSSPASRESAVLWACARCRRGWTDEDAPAGTASPRTSDGGTIVASSSTDATHTPQPLHCQCQACRGALNAEWAPATSSSQCARGRLRKYSTLSR